MGWVKVLPEQETTGTKKVKCVLEAQHEGRDRPLAIFSPRNRTIGAVGAGEKIEVPPTGRVWGSRKL